MTPSAETMAELAPRGVLRAAINYGNTVLAQRGADGQPVGVSVALAKALAERLGVPVEFITYDAAGKVFAALEQQAWDLAFLAIEPVRAAQIAFSEPYVIIEGTYLLRADDPAQRVAELDSAGRRIAVGQGAAYDLYLSRTLTQAELVRSSTSALAIEDFVAQRLDAAAGVRQPLEAYAAAHPGYRVMADSFTEIRQAMAVPKGHEAAAAYVQAFLDEQLRNGFVARELAATGQDDVRLGTPASN